MSESLEPRDEVKEPRPTRAPSIDEADSGSSPGALATAEEGEIEADEQPPSLPASISGAGPTPPSGHARPTSPRDHRAGRWAPAWATRLPMSARAGWIATMLATALSALVNLSGLDRIRSFIFDETYYVKDAYSLAHLGYEGAWADGSDAAFIHGDFSGLAEQAAYVVHPHTGKWLIALGAQIAGWDNPVGWRLSAAVAGAICVFLVCRIAWNLFRSPAIVLVAGLFLATDGMHIVMSRVGLLDVFLTMFVLAAFLAVIKDQQVAHPRLVRKLAAWRSRTSSDSCVSAGIDEGGADKEAGSAKPPTPSTHSDGLGPHSGSRWWLLGAGVLLGLACSVKWSGIYALAVLGLFVALREWTTRRRAGHPKALVAALVLDVPVAFLAMVPTAIGVYIMSWWSWMIHPQAWAHGKSAASVGPNSGPLAALMDLWAYHSEMWGFHTGLVTPHDYQSTPAQWLFQLRPTSFAYERVPGSCPGADASEQCVRNVVALGNPALWWLAVPALLVAVWAVLRWRNWRVGLILCGYLAMYVPWFSYSERTIFQFYTVALAPFVALVLAWVVGVLLEQTRLRVDPDRGYSASDTDPKDRRWMGSNDAGRDACLALALAIVVVVVATSVYFYTVWTGVAIPYHEWLGRMWLKSWI